MVVLLLSLITHSSCTLLGGVQKNDDENGNFCKCLTCLLGSLIKLVNVKSNVWLKHMYVRKGGDA